MLTVTQLARKYNLSRSTILYYERQGLLVPCRRGENGYRWYGPRAEERLSAILTFRAFGVAVAELPSLLQQTDHNKRQLLLRTQFGALDREIKALKMQQLAIMRFLDDPNISEETMIQKDKWVEIMRAAGMDDNMMKRWHQQFETLEPEGHQEFLESLGIDQKEIEHIRSWSKNRK